MARRTETVSVRLTTNERDQLEAAAEDQDLNLSEYLRAAGKMAFGLKDNAEARDARYASHDRDQLREQIEGERG